MKCLLLPLLSALFLINPTQAQKKDYVPEGGSVEEKAKKPKKQKVDPKLPMVLILGDSISIGYTPQVAQAFAGKANIIHNPGNSQGTTHTKANIDKWLKMQKWDVIHFNLGLHDLKRVKKAGTGPNSNDPKDPYQADLATYTTNLSEIVAKLKATNAKLIFATTTPFPAGVKPHRDPADAQNYNKAALKIMEKNQIPINDLHGLVVDKLDTVQKPVNVHFNATGTTLFAKEVAKKIGEALDVTPAEIKPRPPKKPRKKQPKRK